MALLWVGGITKWVTTLMSQSLLFTRVARVRMVRPRLPWPELFDKNMVRLLSVVGQIGITRALGYLLPMAELLLLVLMLSALILMSLALLRGML